jgi:hypothetical protein
MGQFRTNRTFDFIFICIVIVLLSLATTYRIALGDWVFFLTYQPTSETIQVANDAGLSPVGRRLFYRTDPQFVSKAEVSAQCAIEDLGCITSSGQVFIYDAPRQHNQTVVTAAHEMLHLAYRRLSGGQKQSIVQLLDQGIALNQQKGLQDELQGLSGDDEHDEAHSLLGSEYTSLPSGLEQYYSKYFSNRSKVVSAEAASQATSP